MTEDFIGQALRLAKEAGLGTGGLLLVIFALALVLTLMKAAGRVKLPPAPPPSPDLVETPPAPPIPVRADGSIPVANPLHPPDPIP